MSQELSEFRSSVKEGDMMVHWPYCLEEIYNYKSKMTRIQVFSFGRRQDSSLAMTPLAPDPQCPGQHRKLPWWVTTTLTAVLCPAAS